jgi:hypothetical protein
LRSERLERLERLRVGLLADDREQLWERMDRGASFACLAPAPRPYLPPIFKALR